MSHLIVIISTLIRAPVADVATLSKAETYVRSVMLLTFETDFVQDGEIRFEDIGLLKNNFTDL